MKKWGTGGIRILLAGTVALLLTGCTDAIPEMTEEQQNMVTEYAAELLLKYDANYHNTILTEEESIKAEEELIRDAELQVLINEQRQQAQQNQETENGGSEEESSSEAAEPVYTDIDSFLGLSNAVEIEYTGYLVCDSYPENTEMNDWQGVARATSANNKLVVFSFRVTNVSGSDYLFDMASIDTRFSFKINNSVTKSSLTTLLFNDFKMYRDTIPAGGAVDAVLVIEMPAADAEQMTSIRMIMKLGSERAETTLL
ncbi:MAG: hypothetical protein J6K26_06755 [Lachnospiraceae bacterium]|nr:hypothetical protein [Lachnospiraceae bacterium]